MGRNHANATKEAIKTWAGYVGLKQSLTAVGTTAIPIPAANLDQRKGVLVQNLDAAKIVYVGGSVPEIIAGTPSDAYGKSFVGLQWKYRPASGTNEWYCVSSTGGDPGLTSPAQLYYQAWTGTKGTETVATKGTIATIAAEHGWSWGADPTSTFNTIYIRTDGALAANSPANKYRVILTYATVPDYSAGYGYRLGAYGSVYMDLCGSVRLFAIADSASANVLTIEYV